MITLIKVDVGPVDIYELRMKYLAKLKETDGVMLPRFVYRNKELFVTEFKPTCDDQWIMYMTNADGLITKMRIKNGDLISNGSVLMLDEDEKKFTPKKYYDYWAAREGKPAPFFYESIQYHVKSFMRIPGSTELWITAERERGHWYTFRLADDLKSKFTRHTMTNEKGHQTYDWILENVEWTLDTIRYF